MMKRLRDSVSCDRFYPPCLLFKNLWLELIIDEGLRDWAFLTRARLRRVCYWFATHIAPLVPPYDGAAYTAEMHAWRAFGLEPPPRLGFGWYSYPWYHSRCPTCGSFRESVEGRVVTCHEGHAWCDPRLVSL